MCLLEVLLLDPAPVLPARGRGARWVLRSEVRIADMIEGEEEGTHRAASGEDVVEGEIREVVEEDEDEVVTTEVPGEGHMTMDDEATPNSHTSHIHTNSIRVNGAHLVPCPLPPLLLHAQQVNSFLILHRLPCIPQVKYRTHGVIIRSILNIKHTCQGSGTQATLRHMSSHISTPVLPLHLV